MNRLREVESLSLGERWLLASAYKLAGKPDVAKALVEHGPAAGLRVRRCRIPTPSARCCAIARSCCMGTDAARPRRRDRRAARGRRRRSSRTASWYSTQSVAFALVAVAQNTGTKPFKGFSFDYAAGNARKQTVKGDAPLANIKLPPPPAAGAAADADQHLGPQAVRHGGGARHRRAAARKTPPRTGSTLERRLQRRRRQAGRRAQASRRAAISSRRSRCKNVSKRAARQSRAVAAGARGLGDPQRPPRGVDTQGERSTEQAAARRSSGGCRRDGATQALRSAEYVDIRDDRVQRYFSLRAGESIFFETRLNAAYLGRFYLPGASIEAMYDAKQHARLKGQWVEVVSPQR